MFSFIGFIHVFHFPRYHFNILYYLAIVAIAMAMPVTIMMVSSISMMTMTIPIPMSIAIAMVMISVVMTPIPVAIATMSTVVVAVVTIARRCVHDLGLLILIFVLMSSNVCKKIASVFSPIMCVCRYRYTF